MRLLRREVENAKLRSQISFRTGHGCWESRSGFSEMHALARHHWKNIEVLPRHRTSQFDNSEPSEPWDQGILLKKIVYIFDLLATFNHSPHTWKNKAASRRCGLLSGCASPLTLQNHTGRLQAPTLPPVPHRTALAPSLPSTHHVAAPMYSHTSVPASPTSLISPTAAELLIALIINVTILLYLQ